MRLNPGNIGGPEKVAEVIAKAKPTGTPMRIGVNSGSLPKHLRELESDNPVEALVTAAIESVELMERLDFHDFKVSMKSTNGPEHDRLQPAARPRRSTYPLHLGVTEAGTKWSGSLKSAVGLGTLLADGIGDTIRISLSTFHAEEEVKVAWEILKALKLRERGPVLIACPTCGRLQFDMDTVVAEVERGWRPTRTRSRSRCSAARSTASARRATPTSASPAPRTWAMIYSKGEPLQEGAAPASSSTSSSTRSTSYYAAGKTGRTSTRPPPPRPRAWLAENEDDTAMTPERIAALEREQADREAQSPVAGRGTRA